MRKNILFFGHVILFLLVIASFHVPTFTCANPTSNFQAKRAVQNWIAMDAKPLKESIGSKVKGVLTYNDNHGAPFYHIVYMEPQGFVIVAGDDLIEPIIAFVPDGKQYDDSPDNPLGALVTADVPGRVKRVRGLERSAAGAISPLRASSVMKAKKKWSLLDLAEPPESLAAGATAISDVRVAPLLQTNWSQTTESGGNQCYNLFTPNHYPCGCVATAFAQVMRFFQYPDAAVGTPSFTISVDDEDQNRSLLGGDGNGGVYNWLLMADGPSVSLAEQRVAIGRLTHDAGVSVNMNYAAYGTAGNTLAIADGLKSVFGYSNAVKGFSYGSDIPIASRNAMANPNLDAGYPVILGIYGESGGHAIISDGYGYNSSTLYHHLNLGWSGFQNAWYNLPDIDISGDPDDPDDRNESNEFDDSDDDYHAVYKVVYNIFPVGTGEIISGRITDSAGIPIAGVTVSAQRTEGEKYTAITVSEGIYALAKIPSASTYQLSAVKAGYAFAAQTAATLTSADIATVGNRWGIDFVDTPAANETFPWLLFFPAIQGIQHLNTP